MAQQFASQCNFACPLPFRTKLPRSQQGRSRISGLLARGGERTLNKRQKILPASERRRAKKVTQRFSTSRGGGKRPLKKKRRQLQRKRFTMESVLCMYEYRATHGRRRGLPPFFQAPNSPFSLALSVLLCAACFVPAAFSPARIFRPRKGGG